jgi:hypothetical protein
MPSPNSRKGSGLGPFPMSIMKSKGTRRWNSPGPLFFYETRRWFSGGTPYPRSQIQGLRSGSITYVDYKAQTDKAMELYRASLFLQNANKKYEPLFTALCFLLLLQVGEYTMPRRAVQIRTVQFTPLSDKPTVLFYPIRARQICCCRPTPSHFGWTTRRMGSVGQQSTTLLAQAGSVLLKRWLVESIQPP